MVSDFPDMSSSTATSLNVCGFSRVTYWHGIRGGMDVHGRSISEGLVGRGHRVTILTTRHPSGKRFTRMNDVDIHYLDKTVFGSRRNGWPAESTSQLRRLHRRDRFDIIWSQSFDAFGLMRPGGPRVDVPIVATLHGSMRQEVQTAVKNIIPRSRNPSKLLRSFAGLFYSYFVTHRPVLKRADCIITVSPTIVDEIASWYGRSLTRKCITIPNGVNTDLFCVDEKMRDAIRRDYGISDKDILLLSLGRLTHEKGHHLALQAVGALGEKTANLKLLIVGDGPRRHALEASARRLNLTQQVKFAGAVTHEETARFFNAADIFVMPSVTVEGLPMVLLEAMACAKPVIASRCGGIQFAVEDGENGLLFDPGAAGQLTAKLKQLIASRQLCQRLALTARRTVQDRFDVNQTIDQVEEVLCTLVQKKDFHQLRKSR